MNHVERLVSQQGGPVIIRNVTRALEADIYTAFAFSENEGTNYLANLRPGANTVDDTGMGQIDLFHDEKRDPYWFWESEAPSLFRYVFPYVSRGGQSIHAKAEKWISDLMSHYEEGMKTSKEAPESTYGKMFSWRDVETGKPLTRKERASEIMDDCREFDPALSLEFHADSPPQLLDRTLCRLPWNL